MRQIFIAGKRYELFRQVTLAKVVKRAGGALFFQTFHVAMSIVSN
jgi:hypothetical protein